jgi:hypothetical protein
MDKDGLFGSFVAAGFTQGAVDIPERIAHRQQSAQTICANRNDKGF